MNYFERIATVSRGIPPDINWEMALITLVRVLENSKMDHDHREALIGVAGMVCREAFFEFLNEQHPGWLKPEH